MVGRSGTQAADGRTNVSHGCRIGISGSASFHSARKSRYAAWLWGVAKDSIGACEAELRDARLTDRVKLVGTRGERRAGLFRVKSFKGRVAMKID